MPRTHVKKPGSRPYKNYNLAVLQEAVSRIKSGSTSILQASKTYGIPFGTLRNKVKGLHTKPVGGQTIFSFQEEEAILKAITTCGDWGYPLTLFDLQLFTKSYLDRQGRTVHAFKNNVPGVDWAYSLLKRHKSTITQRLASNISRSRAQVSSETVNSYFDNLQETVKDVPLQNIFNYDESNVTDDPGKQRVLYRRGVKYPEKVMNHSKSATTIMICASASGVLLPPYTVYKSEHMWDTWTKGGPRGYPCCQEPCCSRGARYNRTSHGWMEAKCFTDWFETIFLPHAKRLEGQKVLIGDNLASHFTEEVLRLCEVNDISFVCLPPNSTHICQPLDVSFFRPFKIAWRAVLTQWKMEHKCESRIRKETFPSLLAVAIRKMDMPKSKENGQHEGGAVASNIISGFAATGIAPLNRDRVLNKIPHTQVVDGVAINDSLVEYLEKQRFPNKNTCARTGTGMRKKKIQVQPGKSVSAPTYDTDSSTAEEEVNLQDDSDDTGTVNQEIDTPTEDVLPEYTDPSEDNLQAGAYILVKFLSGKRKTVHFKYVCIIQSVINTGASREYEVLALKSVDTHKMAFCPRSDDVSLVDISDIIAVLPEPRLVLSGDRLRYHFNFTVDVKEV